MDYKINENATEDEALFYLCSLRENPNNGNITWPMIADIMNANFGQSKDESTYRRRYAKIKDQFSLEEVEKLISIEESVVEKQKEQVIDRDEKTHYNAILRNIARDENFLDKIKDKITHLEPIPRADVFRKSDTAVYAILSDIHYGIEFHNYFGSYDANICKKRVMEYAEEIIATAMTNNAHVCYLTLLGDLISGEIHTTIRVENRENAVSQVVGVGELIAEFIYRLSEEFDYIYINSVGGNHSRIIKDPKEAMRGDNLDQVVLWYLKTKLEKITRIIFVDNEIDSSISSFTIFGKNYVAVHGDLDDNIDKSICAINMAMEKDKPMDYFILGHKHVVEASFNRIPFIRNGCVCGSGDEFTAKKRLFGDPYQVCMIVSNRGIEYIRPVKLD